MKIIKTVLYDLSTEYPLSKLDDISKTIFIDIETTGFVAKSSQLYLIGAIYFKEDNFHLIQWFAQKPAEEVDILSSFLEFLKPFHTIIHYNGNQFDIPYLTQKAAIYKLAENFVSLNGIDLYKRIQPLKRFLKLPDCKLKTIEVFLNIARDDLYSGGELIQVYKNYVLKPSADILEVLLLHNADDMKGMIKMLPILAYPDLFTGDLRVKKVQANFYKDIDGRKRQEVIMKCSLPSPLPISISYGSHDCYFIGFGLEGTLRVPLYEEELKYFYTNYRDYYYLPQEDVAIHKSVAAFVDMEFKAKASAATCYTRKVSTYLPQWKPIFEPVFLRNFKDRDLYFELTDDLKKDRSAFSTYASHILQMMLKD